MQAGMSGEKVGVLYTHVVDTPLPDFKSLRCPIWSSRHGVKTGSACAHVYGLSFFEVLIKSYTMRMCFALSLYSYYDVSYPSTHTNTNTHTHTHPHHPPYLLVSFPISQMWGKCRRSQGGVCVPQGPLFLLNCRETPHVQKTQAHTYTHTHTNKVNTMAQLVHPCCECLNLCLTNLLEFYHAVANFQTGLEKWLCFVCHLKCLVLTCVSMRRIFPTVDCFIIAPASLFTPELGRRILSFSFFFLSVFFSTIQQTLYQQHRQTLEWTLSAGSFPHCGHCSPPMDNGFPAQGGMLEMSVRKRAEQDGVSVGPLCSLSANLVKTTLGQQTRMHTPSLPHSTCLAYLLMRGCITILFVVWKFKWLSYMLCNNVHIPKSAYNPCYIHNCFINKNIYKHPLSVCVFLSDDRGEAMSGPSPGWQEAGAPCTGDSLLLSTSPLLLFVLFLPPLSLQTLISSRRGRSDVWRPAGLTYCWPREIWSAVGDFALSWCSPDLSTITPTHTYTHTHTQECACKGPSPNLLSL